MAIVADATSSDTGSRVLLACGAAALYLAARAAGEVLAPVTLRSAAPGRRAIGHWLPIAAVAVFATLVGHSELALAVIFATAVASLSLLNGIVIYVDPEATAPPRWRRVWPFILPTALLALLCGFSGRLTWIHAIILLVEGTVLLMLWRDSGDEPQHVLPAMPGDSDEPQPDRRAGANFILAGALAIIGAWALVRGATGVTGVLTSISFNLIVVILISPLLVAPMFISGATLSQKGRAWEATTTNIAVVLLNLCLLLPTVALLWYPSAAGWFAWLRRLFDWQGPISTASQPTSMPLALREVDPMVYSVSVWRVDTVVLVMLGLLLFPVALGRWRLGRGEGLALIGVYVAYVLAAIIVGFRA
jgi:Ca2+/Na+ antiporter